MDFFSSNFQSWDPNTVWTNFRPRFQSLNLVRLRASRRALVFWVSFLKKEKEDKKSLSTLSSIHVFYPGGAARHLCLALSASHSFLDFGEAVEFYPFLLAILFYIIAISRFQLFIDTRALGDARIRTKHRLITNLIALIIANCQNPLALFSLQLIHIQSIIKHQIKLQCSHFSSSTQNLSHLTFRRLMFGSDKNPSRPN